MKNIAVFLDGTQNRSEGTNLTNIAKLFMLASTVTPEGEPQLKFYSPGVGVYRALDKVWTVLTGVGVQISLRQAYQFVCANFDPGCRVFIFGFSRGAFSARHLAGMIARIGILRGPDIAYARDAYEYYRSTITGRNPSRRFPSTEPHPVHFLGLWDTVAATRPFLMGGNRGLYGDILEPEILNVRHALARKERRYSFYPQSYQGIRTQYVTKWFSGYHCDIGGSYPEENSYISNAALLWMIQQAASFGFAVPEEFPWRHDSDATPTPHEYPWTPFLNRPRNDLYHADPYREDCLAQVDAR